MWPVVCLAGARPYAARLNPGYPAPSFTPQAAGAHAVIVIRWGYAARFLEGKVPGLLTAGILLKSRRWDLFKGKILDVLTTDVYYIHPDQSLRKIKESKH